MNSSDRNAPTLVRALMVNGATPEQVRVNVEALAMRPLPDCLTPDERASTTASRKAAVQYVRTHFPRPTEA
jgi:hypothetical protein